MDGTAEGARSRKRRTHLRRNVLIALGIVFGIALAGGGILALHIQGFHRRLASECDKALDAIRKAGHPATIEELQDWYGQIPDEENAAPIYLEAFSKIVWDEEEMEEHPAVEGGLNLDAWETISDEDAQFGLAWIEKNREAIQLLHKASSFVQCRYPLDSELWPLVSASLGRSQDALRAARLLGVDAALHTEGLRGESTAAPARAAVRSIASLLALGRSLSAEPHMISHLLRGTILVIAIRSLERILSQTEIDDEGILTLLSFLDESALHEGIARSVIAERCISSRLYELPSNDLHKWLSDGEPTLGWRFSMMVARIHGWPQKEQLRYLGLSLELQELCELPFPERLDALAEFEEHLLDDSGTDVGHFRSLTKLMLQPHLKVCVRLGECIAKLRCARTALAIERYRAARGALPDDLTALVPEFLDSIPVSPYDRSPLRYRTLERGFSVWAAWDPPRRAPEIKITYAAGQEPPPDPAREGLPPGIIFSVKR